MTTDTFIYILIVIGMVIFALFNNKLKYLKTISRNSSNILIILGSVALIYNLTHLSGHYQIINIIIPILFVLEGIYLSYKKNTK